MRNIIKFLIGISMISSVNASDVFYSPLSPPEKGSMRMTFLVSDRLYFGQAPMEALQADALAGPVVNSLMRLLQLIVKSSTDE